MPTDRTIIANLKRLWRNIRAGTIPAAEDLPDLAADWSLALGDVADPDLDAAVIAWLRGASPFWPTPGQILALVPARRLAAVDDSAAAWAEVQAWCRTRGRCTETNLWRAPQPGELDDDDARDAAMRAGLDAVGGTSGWATRPTAEAHWTARTFAEAYRAARTGERVASEVRAIADTARTPIGTTPGSTRIGTRGSGFARVGELTEVRPPRSGEKLR